MGAIGDLIRIVAEFVPLWILVIAGAIAGLLAVPGLRTGLRVKRVKALLRKVTRAEGPQRQALLDDAWREADGYPEVLITLAREADKLNQPALRDRATRALRKLGGHEMALRKLDAKPPANDRAVKHPVEAAVTIRTMIENGAFEAARARLSQARKQFPGDADWEVLQRAIDAGSTASD